MSTYSDGSWATATQVGADRYSMDADTRARIIRRTMQIAATSWVALARGTAGPTLDAGATATQLIDETEPNGIGHGIVEWERIYSTIPASRDEYETFVFQYQNLDQSVFPDIALIGTSLLSIPVPVTSRVAYAYFDAAVTAPSAVTLYKAAVVGETSGTLYFIGTAPAFGATEFVGEDSTLRRWKNSNIYERITRYVPADGLEEVV